MLKLQSNALLKSAKSDDSIVKIENSWIQMLKRQDLGFLRLPFDQRQLKVSVELGKQIKKDFSHLVLVGIGGSSMGPRALCEISGTKNVSILDNVDAIETDNILTDLSDLSKTAWLFISKSGSTIEVLWTLELIQQYYSEKKISFWPNTYFITENTVNPLKLTAQQFERPCLEIPMDVGGRFSVLSPVGLVMAEYLNFSPEQMLEGAKVALNSKDLALEAIHQYLSSFERKEDITLFWFYSSRMRWFGCWLQQLWAESLGKKETLTGKKAPDFSSPMISIGTCDQHSILQQVIEGPKNKFVNVFRFKQVEKSSFSILKTRYNETKILEGLNFGDLIKAEALATERAMHDSQISTMLFELPDLSDRTLGFMFMYFQLIVACIGEHTNINAFNQPGVALSKKLTLELLEQSKTKTL